MNTTINKIYEAYEKRQSEQHRPHLGASIIGHNCERYIWNKFHWVYAKKHKGQLLRLFETGLREESRFIDNLRAAGVEVFSHNDNGEQIKVSALNGHFGGSMDGGGRGFVEAPKAWHVIEFKTHNDKSFVDLRNKGVQQSKPQHYAQMQVYMGLSNLNRAYYLAVNKNTDELYGERVEFCEVEFEKLMLKAKFIIESRNPPVKISDNPGHWECKFCEFYDNCHQTRIPEYNCRTCRFSKANTHETDELDKWTCEQHGHGLTDTFQRLGCRNHEFIPAMVENFAHKIREEKGQIFYRSKQHPEFEFSNGVHGTWSKNIALLKDGVFVGDEVAMKMNEVFGYLKIELQDEVPF